MRRGRVSRSAEEVARGIWQEWVALFLAEERDAKGRRPRTLELHAENLKSMRAALDAVGTPADPGAIGVSRPLSPEYAEALECGKRLPWSGTPIR